jgi:hypothetical protein
MLPIIFVIITAIFIYRTARDNGHNAVLWTVVAVVGYLIIQLGIGLFAGVVIGIGIAAWGWPESALQDYNLLIGLGALVPAIGYVLIIWKIVNRVKDDAPLPKRAETSIFDRNDP